MGFFDRLLNSGSKGSSAEPQQKPKAEKQDDSFFLDSDASSYLGDRNYMREAKTIRRTFPVTAENRGGKELETPVDAMDLTVET